MKKYLAALVVVLGLAFVVARQDQHAADQAAQKAAELHKAAVAASPNEQHPKENIENPAGNSPRWYILCLYSLFRWPNGTTTWAIILTLIAIAEQAGESAKATQAMLDSIPHQKMAAEAAQNSAAFFKVQNRPWVGVSEELTMLWKKSTKPGQYEFTAGYTLKNFGSAPALNTVVCWGPIVEDVNNYNVVKEKVAEARKSGENIVSMTGNLLLPSAEKYDTCLFGETKRPPKIVIPGCVVYRDTDGIIHHTELSYWIDFAEGEKAAFHTAWFQSAD